MMEQNRERFLNKKMEFLSALWFQVDRISKYIMEMDHYKAKDIRKLKKMIDDLESDLEYHIKTKEAMPSNGSENIKTGLEAVEKINEKIKSKNVFDDPEGYMDMLTDKKAELINLAGMCGLLPQYQDGMPIYVR